MSASRLTLCRWAIASALPAALSLVSCDSSKAKQTATREEAPPSVNTAPSQETKAAPLDKSLLPPGIDTAEVPLWKLVWRDEFDGATFDTAKWDYRYLGPREGAIMSKDCVTVENGMARIWVKEQEGVLHNGMISTHKKFEPRYGIIAGRIRFPRQQGQHGSIWMQPAKGEKVADDPAHSGAEIDIIEWFGERWDAGTAVNLYWPGMKNGKLDVKANHAGGAKDFKVLPKGELPSDDFHIYSVEWTSKGYIFRMDGHETYRITEGVSQVDQFLILSLFSADWEAPRLDRTKLPNSMDVDWVRVWQADSPPERDFTQK
jgi:beta-glucanase (GH16 family)